MQKSRYKFSANDRAMLYDVSKLPVYKKEVSLFVKELYVYSINLKELSMQRPRPIIKDELLNIAVICKETKEVLKHITLNRTLPYKLLSSRTNKPQKFFERWHGYILAYFILLNNEKYSTLSSFLNIVKNDPLKDTKGDSNNSVHNYSAASVETDREASGILLRNKNKKCYILTSSGEFCSVIASHELTIGEICTGREKIDRNYFKVPLRLFIIIAIVISVFIIYQYNQIGNTTVISSIFNLKINSNRFGRVISITALNKDGNTIKESTKVLNKTLDSALVSILDAGIKNSLIKENTSINIFISSNDNTTPHMDETRRFIQEKNIKAIINNNGRKLSVK